MLKIKDNVDLKELENFGLELVKRNDSEYFRIKLGTSNNRAYLKVQPISRKLLIDTDATYILELDMIYDLTQAGLVEKVEE